MNIWLQIGSAVVVVLMLVFLYPTAKQWMTDGPRAKPGDWQAALILLLVVGFVVLLILLVKG